MISRLLPTNNTKLHFGSFVISRSLLIPIPKYAAASSRVKHAFSQTGTENSAIYLAKRIRKDDFFEIYAIIEHSVSNHFRAISKFRPLEAHASGKRFFRNGRHPPGNLYIGELMAVCKSVIANILDRCGQCYAFEVRAARESSRTNDFDSVHYPQSDQLHPERPPLVARCILKTHSHQFW